MTFSTFAPLILALSAAAVDAPAAENVSADPASVQGDAVRLSGAPVGFVRNNGDGNWEALGFVIQNDEPKPISMTLCPDKVTRYSTETPEQPREFAFAISTGSGRWSKTCQTVDLAPGEQMLRHAYFKFGEQDGLERLFVLDTNLGQITFVSSRLQAGSPVLANVAQ